MTLHVFMTGATGFVGLNIVEALLAAGHQVTAYVRPDARRRFLERFPVTIATGELADAGTLADAMRGADAVIHTAGDTSCDRRDLSRLWATNVEGTRAVLAAARETGVRRLVYTSTTSTVGSRGGPERRSDENTPLTGFRSRSPYAHTKLAAERLLLSATEDGPEVIILNLAEVIGAFDHTLQWGRIVLAGAVGQMPFIPPGSASFCPAADTGAVHVAALTRGRPGQRYLIGGHDVTIADLIERIARLTGGSATPVNTSPYRLQRLTASLRAAVAPWTGKPPAVDPYRMRVFAGHHLFDDGKARNELGYAPRPLDTAIVECHRWYVDNGFLPPGGDSSRTNS